LELNIPNLLSISRLLLVFPLILFLEINRPLYVFILIIIGGLTDYFDGLIARKFNGLDSVDFIDCQQMYVSNDIDFCIRIMAQVLLPPNYAIKHPYLRGAAKLRTDRC